MKTEALIEEYRRMLLQGAGPAAVTEVRRKLAERGDEAVAQLDSLLSHPSAIVREGTADILESIGTETALDRLVEFALHHLKDPSQQTKFPGPGWQRLRTIGKPVLPAMTRRYDSSLPFDTRLTMIFIAQQIGDPAGRPLVDRALSESDPRLVEAAAEALGAIDGPGAYERLVQLLNAGDQNHRVGAIRGFERLGDKAAVRPLFEALDQVSRRELILNAIDSLAGESFNGDTNRIREWLGKHSF